jgi:hypothetical protein
VVLHVERHLRAPARGEVEAEGAHAGQAAAGLAQAGRDVLRALEVVGDQVDVERDQRRPRGHEQRAGARVHPPRAEVGRELAAVDAPSEPFRAAAAELGAVAVLRARGELAVEEHRQLEVVRDESGRCEGLGARGAALCLVEVDDRRHVEGPHMRVRSPVGPQVDASHRLARAREESLVQVALRRRECEHAAAVIGVRVHVENARPAAECGRDCVDRRAVATLAGVGHRDNGRTGDHHLDSMRAGAP